MAPLWAWIPRAPRPVNRRQLVVALVVRATLFALSVGVIVYVTHPVWSAAALAPVPRDAAGDVRFGLPVSERRAIFTRVVRGEPGYRRLAESRFAPHAFSVNDDRAWGEMHDARALDREREDLTLSQIYLILDEGIRRRWSGPNGQPLEATVPPLDPRR
jgi:hypothetical protein